MAFFDQIDASKIREEPRLVPFLVGLVVLLLGVTVVRRQLGQVMRLREKLRKEEERLTRLEKKVKILSKTDVSELEAKVKRVERIFPSEKPVVSLIATLSNLAEEREVVFSGVTLSPGEVSTASVEAKTAEKKSKGGKTASPKLSYKGELAPAIDFSFQIEGTKEQVFGFLEALERVAPLMKLRTLSLGFGNEGRLLAEVGVYVYFQPPPPTIGKIDAPVAVLTPEEAKTLAVLDEFTLYPEITAGEPSGKENIFSF